MGWQQLRLKGTSLLRITMRAGMGTGLGLLQEKISDQDYREELQGWYWYSLGGYQGDGTGINKPGLRGYRGGCSRLIRSRP